MKTPIGVLNRFQIVRPEHQIEQARALSWLAEAHARSDAATRGAPETESDQRRLMERFFKRYGCNPEKISSRGTEVEDVLHSDFARMNIYSITPERPAGQGMLERARYFSVRARSALSQLYAADTVAPAHLIHVTCTGYVSPSPAQALVDARGWHGQTCVTHAYHMGCYASLPAIRMAGAFVAATGEAVDIAHNEICSLHLDPSDHSPEQMVVQSLFADGHVRYTLSPAEGHEGAGFDVLAIRERIIPKTQDQMSWIASDIGMKMTLSRDVPRSIASQLAGFIEILLADSGLTPGKARANAFFAVHPGGPKIIDSVRDLLELDEARVAHSQEVLRAYGNMSSATLPHVWDSMLRDPAVESGRYVVSLAFGPGLTIFGALLRKG